MAAHVITGPPCAGKSTYIREHAQLSDVVIDLDRLAAALGHEDAPRVYPGVQEVSIAARRMAIDHALRLSRAYPCWIIHTDPSPASMAVYRAWDAEVHTIDPGEAVCLERAERLRPGSISAIRAWYAR